MRVHQCTKERHSECQFFFHQQVCVPNDSEQERLFHNNESLYYSESTTLLEFFERSAVNVLPQGSASNVGTRRLGIRTALEAGQRSTKRTRTGSGVKRVGARWRH
jgi:hypothetical protein